MSELKFSCPSCGQIVECEKAYGGHVIHCPNCCAEIRIPFSNSAFPTELEVPKAQLMLNEPGTKSPAQSSDTTKELLCTCPICQSELRVRVETARTGGPQMAELVRPPVPPAEPPPPEIEHQAEAGPPASKPAKTHTEHEQQLAAARALQKIQANPSLKPRLSYVLDAEQSKTQKPPEPEPKNKPGPADYQKSFQE